jgi:hypothetical protein
MAIIAKSLFIGPRIPNIVSNGLVLHLDAGNSTSYPGSGTTWFDLSGRGNNGTLVNGVGYNSGNGVMIMLIFLLQIWEQL